MASEYDNVPFHHYQQRVVWYQLLGQSESGTVLIGCGAWQIKAAPMDLMLIADTCSTVRDQLQTTDL